MGKYDSSLTRVLPVFDKLFQMDKTGLSWLSKVLSLPRIPNHPHPEIEDTAPIIEARWGKKEKPLPPPRSLLRWLIQNCRPPDTPDLREGKITREERQGLVRKDPKIINEALSLLDQRKIPKRDWYVLEGPSQPDVYLETENMIIVIEGKRTEPNSTAATKWMPVRHQMLRHMDCAWEIRGSKRVYGFFSVEGDGGADAYDVPEKWIEAIKSTVSDETLKNSLPHRKSNEIKEIAESFLGATTWQAVCKEFGIEWKSLPDSVQ